MRRTPQDILDFIQQQSEKYPPAKIVLLLNNEFGCNYSPQQISEIKRYYNFPLYKNPIQNPALKKFICEQIKGKSLKELTELVNKTFNSSFSQQKIRDLKARLKLSNGINVKFKKGQTPWNKGKKGCKSFSKPIGSERITSNGYIQLKVKEPNVWMHKQRYLYEKHIGKIPPGTMVSFKDGNRQNFNLDNLILMSLQEAIIMTHNKFWSNNPEITQAGHTLSKIILKTTELKEQK